MPAEGFDWEEKAECRRADPEKFFPEHGNDTAGEAKKVCRHCTVKTECLDYAVTNDERFGIWGGLTARERNKLKRRVA